MSSTTVRRLFNIHCDQERGKLSRVLSIDEFKGNTNGKKFNLSICDPSNKQIIDILPNRFKSNLIDYFSAFSKQELKNVKVITMDMYHVYYDIAKQVFPKAAIVIDPFHFVRLVTNASNNTRIRLMKKFKKNTMEYKLLKHNWRLFLKKEAHINEELRFNSYKRVWESHSNTLDQIRNIHPELNKVREMLESFYDIVHKSVYPTVHHDLTNWIVQAKLTNIGELREAALSIERWLPEICNSFMINPDTNTRYSSAFIEGMNNFIKVIKRTSYGFQCFTTFRNRIMYNHRNCRRVIKV
jgi:transposase